MNEEVNVKAIAVVILSAILGGYVILFEKQVLAGIIVIAGGISLNFLEVVKWVKELYSLIRFFSNEVGDQTQIGSTQSTQVKASGKSTVNVKYVVPQNSEKIKEDKTPQLIDEIHSDLSKSRL